MVTILQPFNQSFLPVTISSPCPVAARCCARLLWSPKWFGLLRGERRGSQPPREVGDMARMATVHALHGHQSGSIGWWCNWRWCNWWVICEFQLTRFGKDATECVCVCATAYLCRWLIINHHYQPFPTTAMKGHEKWQWISDACDDWPMISWPRNGHDDYFVLQPQIVHENH